VLQPLALMITFTIISRFIRIPSDGLPFPIFIYAALVPWTFFSNAVIYQVTSLVSNAAILRKIYFPREVFPVAAALTALFDFLMSATVLVGMMFWYRVPVGAALGWVPVLVAVQMALAVGLGLLGSAVTVYARDLRYAVPFLLQLGMYASPVIYPMSAVPQAWRPWYGLNPMAPVIEGYRAALLRNEMPDLNGLALAAAVSILLLMVSFAAFKRMEPAFADVV
jgi:lipopolysaccharide transport system permease protein